MILVDTSVWIDFFRGRDTAYRRALHALLDKDLDICLAGIILTEILQGVKDEKAGIEMEEYLRAFPMYHPRSVATYIEAARIYRQCMKKGKTVRRTVDCIIAAIAIEHGLTLLHNDSDFGSIAACTGLQVFEAAP